MPPSETAGPLGVHIRPRPRHGVRYVNGRPPPHAIDAGDRPAKEARTMTPERQVVCPHCRGTDFEVEHLGNPATTWKVTFGSQLFRKSELRAYACKKCGAVSLFINVDETSQE